MPPPPADQPISWGPGPRTVVPPTPTAYGEDAGYSTEGMPAGTPLTPTTAAQNTPVSPEETNSDWPCAAAWASVTSSASVKPVAHASSSHSPALNDACRVALSVTQRLIVARMSSFDSDAPSYTFSWVTPGARPVEYCVSRSHSSEPDVSVEGAPTWIWFQVTCGRPKWSSNVARSAFGCDRSPSAITESSCRDPFGAPVPP